MEIISRDINKESKIKGSEEIKKEKGLVEKYAFKVKGNFMYSFTKRAFDIFASLIAIIILAIPMFIVGLLVKMSSKGPAIYVSKRVGKNGKVFNMYKFRSMYQDADERLSDLLGKNEVEGGITFKMKNDPRITKFGKIIRKTSIDELPQLFNILKGDMTIIGPRAGLVSEVAQYNDYQKRRLLVPQGLSGEWQTHGRSNTSFDEMIEMDLEYITKKRSLFYDIKLIFLTFIAVFKRDGAE